MSSSPLLWLVIPLITLTAIVAGAVLVSRTQRRGMSLGEPQSATPSREDFVRRHRNRSGVVANGATLVDLYDRINQLEMRVVELEKVRDR